MKKQKDTFALRSKIWIEDDCGKVVFGLGRFRMLEEVGRLGSMQAAAKELKMSYRAIWCRIRESEERIGRELVVREGKGSRLTAFAQNLMQQFTELESRVVADADRTFERLFFDAFGK